jgi:glycosyltransferase involved in cell wall biosynthesis
MEKLAERGHQVVCLCTAETSFRPWVHWTKSDGAFPIYRIFNGGIYSGVYSQGGVGTRRPDLDVRCPAALRRAVLQILKAESPEVVSFQSLFGLPFSLLSEITQSGTATVFTAHDYFALCPTAHLFLPDQTVCRLQTQQLTCDACCKDSLNYPVFWITRRLNRLIDFCGERAIARKVLCRLRNGLYRANRAWNRIRTSQGPYRIRRDAAIQALRTLSVVHCISKVQASIVQELTGGLPNLQILPLHPSSAQRLVRRKFDSDPERPVRFVALNVHAPYKGSDLLARVFGRLEASRLPFELHFYGLASAQRIQSPCVHYHGRYRAEDLEHIAAGADFCLMPSLWHETLGFVGMEMMARGVPLIVSSRAGASDFVESETTGFVFDPEPDEPLYELLKRLILDSGLRVQVQANLARCEAALKTFDQHVIEMENLFREASLSRSKLEKVCCK